MSTHPANIPGVSRLPYPTPETVVGNIFSGERFTDVYGETSIAGMFYREYAAAHKQHPINNPLLLSEDTAFIPTEIAILRRSDVGNSPFGRTGLEHQFEIGVLSDGQAAKLLWFKTYGWYDLYRRAFGEPAINLAKIVLLEETEHIPN